MLKLEKYLASRKPKPRFYGHTPSSLATGLPFWGGAWGGVGGVWGDGYKINKTNLFLKLHPGDFLFTVKFWLVYCYRENNSLPCFCIHFKFC